MMVTLLIKDVSEFLKTHQSRQLCDESHWYPIPCHSVKYECKCKLKLHQNSDSDEDLIFQRGERLLELPPIDATALLVGISIGERI